MYVHTSYTSESEWDNLRVDNPLNCDRGVIDFTLPTFICQTCGNELVEVDESCDDWNLLDDDGCESCQTEVGFVCLEEPSECEQVYVCGDGDITIDP